MRRAASILLIALSGIVPGSFGQSPSDFSGVWKMDPARSESAHQDALSASTTSTLVIVFAGDHLTMETTRSEAHKPAMFHETLNLSTNGAETTSQGNGGIAVTGKAHWEDTKLIVETDRNVQGSTVTTRYVHTLSANGREMTVDKTLTVQHGYQGMGATPSGHGKDVFVKVAR